MFMPWRLRAGRPTWLAFRKLASRGYLVVTVDHTHDARLVEIPDRRIERQILSPPGGPGDGDAVTEVALRGVQSTFGWLFMSTHPAVSY